MGMYVGMKAQDGWSTQDYSYATSQMTFKANRVIPPSPDAAELGKYGNVPISLFTGTPNVNIPLYELKGNHVSLPVSLSYNATGFKPQDMASWVGLGWSLNAGGVITRSVIGNPDNASNYFFTNNTYATPPPVDNLYANYDYMDSMQRAAKETQPDMYYFNFAGYSGKFFMGTNQKVICKEKNNLKFTSQGVPNDATGTSYFQIVDENGNTYRFDQVEISMMQQNDAISSTAPVTLNYVYPSSWYLSSITSADGVEVINFSYYNDPSNQTQYGAYLQNISYTYYHNSLNNSSWSFEGSNPVNYGTPPLVTLYNRRYLQSINYVKGGNTIATISLGLAANQRQDLDDLAYPGEQIPQNMTISSYNGQVKKYNFYYSYFGNGTQTQPEYKRLRLDSVSEAVTGLYKPPYSFVYDNTGVASQTQAGIDHWGFANADHVSTLVPSYNTGDGHQYGDGANRNPSLSGSLTAVLKQINYPTGGYTAFTYELNQSGDDVAKVNSDVGGVRIKQMIDYSFPGKQAVIKNYQYMLPDGISSGVAAFPTYVTFSNFHHYAEPQGEGCTLPACTAGTDYNLNMMTLSASSVSGLGMIQGSHIGYSYVTEYQSDSLGTLLGKTVYHYYAGILSSHDDNIANGDLLDKSVYDGAGKLLDKQVNTFNYTGGDSALVGYNVSSAVNQDNHYELCYYTSGGSPVYVWKGQWSVNPSCVTSRIYKNKFSYSGYTISSQWKQLTQEAHTVYDQQSNNYIVTTKKYTYGNPAYTFPTLIEQYSSSNDEIVTSKKYAADYTIPGSGTFDNATDAIKLLQTKNMIGQEIETLVYRQNQDGSNKRYIDGTLSFYDRLFPRLSSIRRLEIAAPVTSLTASTTNGTFTYDANYKALASFSYDGYGNLTEQSKAQDIVTAYIWDYKGFLPTAEVQNANASMVAYSGFESGSLGGSCTFNKNGITAGGRAGVSSFNLSSSYPITGTMAAGRTYVVSYWLHNGSVTVTTNTGSASPVTGAAYNGWTYVEHVLPAGSTQVTLSSAAGANIDELRLFPKDALMTTFTYIPLVGGNSQCTSSNQFTFYQYDGFSRLVNVMDMGGNIVKNFKYNYGVGAALSPSAKTLFYSAAKQGNYTKQGCVAPTEPTTETYLVPFGKYVSSINQADADAKAQADVTANGQAYANSVGKCFYWNVDKYAYFSKNNCLPEQGGSLCTGGTKPFNTKYDVPAHTYSSLISQGAADTLALNDIAANGQNYANNFCTCSCMAEGKKVVNGTCETGTRWNSSTTQMPNGTWQCIYYYQFSDGSVSQNYTSYGSSPCPIQ